MRSFFYFNKNVIGSYTNTTVDVWLLGKTSWRYCMVLLVLTIILVNLIAFLIPKRLSKMEMYTTSLFATYFACQTDVYLNLKHHLYGYFSGGIDYEVLLVLWGVYPAYNLIYLNYYPFHTRAVHQVVYIIGHAVFVTFYEWLSTTEIGFFYHNEWKLWYSAVLYPFVLYILTLHLLFLRKLKKTECRRE